MFRRTNKAHTHAHTPVFFSNTPEHSEVFSQDILEVKRTRKHNWGGENEQGNESDQRTLTIML